MYKIYYSKADVDRLRVKRIKGGRDLLQTEGTSKAEIINTAQCSPQIIGKTSV